MTILIYRLDTVNGKPEMVEYGRFDGRKITGRINRDDTNRESVINEFNRGYWRTSEI